MFEGYVNNTNYFSKSAISLWYSTTNVNTRQTSHAFLVCLCNLHAKKKNIVFSISKFDPQLKQAFENEKDPQKRSRLYHTGVAQVQKRRSKEAHSLIL